MKKIIALMMALVMVFALAACGAPAADEGGKTDEGTAPAAVSAENIKIGVILIGDENEGYSYAHMEGIEAACKALGIDKESQLIYKFSVLEDESCYDAAVDLAENGCNIIFANSFGHEPHLMQAAEEYPDIYFCHATGYQAATSELTNFCNYFTDIYESRYVSGVVAGLKLKELMDKGTVTDPYIGYVGAYPYAEVVSGYTAFFLGIRSIVPEAHMDVTYTNEWFNIAAEGEAANMLMSRGCVIIGQHADSTGAPAAVQAALDGGKVAYSVGYNVDMLSVAPDAALTSAQNNWVVTYEALIKVALEGGKLDTDYSFGYADDAVQISALGASCAKGTQKAVDDAIAAIKDGSLHVFDTSKWTVNGETVTTTVSDDLAETYHGVEYITDGYFHESESASAPAFAFRIDGITELKKS
jgi:basic membrane protein A